MAAKPFSLVLKLDRQRGFYKLTGTNLLIRRENGQWNLVENISWEHYAELGWIAIRSQSYFVQTTVNTWMERNLQGTQEIGTYVVHQVEVPKPKVLVLFSARRNEYFRIDDTTLTFRRANLIPWQRVQSNATGNWVKRRDYGDAWAFVHDRGHFVAASGRQWVEYQNGSSFDTFDACSVTFSKDGHDVFISRSGVSSTEAMTIYDFFKSNGFTAFVATSFQEFRLDKLADEVQKCRYFLIILSQAYFRSVFCLIELAAAARDHPDKIISVILKDTPNQFDFNLLASIINNEATLNGLLNDEEWSTVEANGFNRQSVREAVMILAPIIACDYSASQVEYIRQLQLRNILSRIRLED